MTERAAHLIDAVLPAVRYRQWVLSLPHALRYVLAFDHALARRVLAIFIRAVQGLQRRRARQQGIVKSQLGGVTVIQRFASGLRLNLHFHSLLTDGVFHEDACGQLVFCPLPPPTEIELARLVATVRRRVLGLLERLCRYILRPAVAQDRLRLTERGQVALQLKARWGDGTSHLVLEPAELLARLASLVPRPRTNLIIYHGVLAANAKWRKRVVAYRSSGAGKGHRTTRPAGSSACAAGHSRASRNYGWAQLMQRAFGIDVLACPGCGGRLRLLATIIAPTAIHRILNHLGLPIRMPELAPARAPPENAA